MNKKVASDKPLPELAEYLQSFHKYFVRTEGRESLERYSTGLLSDIPRKNGQTIEDNPLTVTIRGFSQKFKWLFFHSGFDNTVSPGTVKFLTANARRVQIG